MAKAAMKKVKPSKTVKAVKPAFAVKRGTGKTEPASQPARIKRK